MNNKKTDKLSSGEHNKKQHVNNKKTVHNKIENCPFCLFLFLKLLPDEHHEEDH